MIRGRPAVFLDRDGTIIEQVHHLVDWRLVTLIDGAADAIERLRANGYCCVVVTNQSVIGNGQLSEEGLQKIHDRMQNLLAAHGSYIDAIYYCPIAPESKDRSVIEHIDRKPGPGMLLKAAEELGLDLSRSWMIGDMVSDLLAGKNAGCQATILVQTGNGKQADTEHADYVVDSLIQATDVILNFQEAEEI